MDDAKDQPTDRPFAIEAAASAVVAGAIAAADPLLGIVAGGAIAIANNLIAREWIEVASSRIEAEDLKFNPDDPVIIAAYNRLTIGALQTSRTEKRRLLADALAGAVRGGTPDFLQEVFADLAVRYSPEHIAYLRMIRSPGDVARSYGLIPDGTRSVGDILDLMLSDEEDRDLVGDKIGDDLYRDGLVNSQFGPEVNLSNLGPSEISVRGQRFLNYLAPTPG